jgi:outer membrane protein OmpA-like peptidoglycan-associated protein
MEGSTPVSRFRCSCCLSACLLPASLAGFLEQDQPAPLYKVTVERSIKAVNYRPKGSTKIDFKGTVLAPQTKGEARVETKQGAVQVQAKFENLPPAATFGSEYLTYVLWAISPEGRARNAGEVVLKDQRAELKVATSLQAFGMMLTAEPYFAVSVPSNVVVAENDVRPDTKGDVTFVDAKFELLERGTYVYARGQSVVLDPRIPLDLLQARNAVEIAKEQGADRYSGETFQKAQGALQSAELNQQQKRDRKLVIMSAREATQTAEDARVIANRRAREELAAKQKAEAAEREAAARSRADHEARQKREAELAAAEASARAQREELQKKEAELAATRAQAAAELQAQARKQAETDRLRAELQEQQARQEAERARQAGLEAEAARRRAETEQQQLRATLLKQFNAILETRDTSRGLVVNMGDVLFDTGKYDLRPEAREALAKLSGIVLSHPGLRLDVEGHTDSTGSDEFNQKLSEDRAASVRTYLMEAGVASEAISFKGFGKSIPVGPNDTAKGRQQNRRVEIIISGEVIGVKIG